MEDAFQLDFSAVRVRDNSKKAVDYGARAYTQGANIHMAAGQYNPGTRPGLKLLAHELAHVGQQAAGRLNHRVQRSAPGDESAALESEAHIASERVLTGRDPISASLHLQSPALGLAGPVQRAPEDVPELKLTEPALGDTSDRTAGLTLLDETVPAPRLVRLSDSIHLTVYFSQASNFLDSRSFRAVMSVGQELKMTAAPSVSVDGHASTEGKPEYNQRLSANRRQLVIALLAADLPFKPAFGGSAHGETRPVAEELGSGAGLETNRAQNRRVEILITPSLESRAPDPEKKSPPDLTRRMTFEDYLRVFPPETDSERLNRVLKEGATKPFDRKKVSFADRADEILARGLDRLLRPLVGKKTTRDWVRGKLKDGLKAAGKKGLESAVDALDLPDNTKNAIKNSIEAGWKQPL